MKNQEFLIPIDQSSLHFDGVGLSFNGVLTAPRLSLNGWLYLPEELAAQDGQTVPLFKNHEEKDDANAKPRGRMTVSYDEKTFRLLYKAYTSDKEVIDAIQSKEARYVSAGFKWGGEDIIRGWIFPKDCTLLEGSILIGVPPGILEASVHTDSNKLIAYAKDEKGQFMPLEVCTQELCQSLKSSINSSVPCNKSMADNKKEDAVPEEVLQVVLIRKLDRLSQQIAELWTLLGQLESITPRNEALQQKIDDCWYNLEWMVLDYIETRSKVSGYEDKLDILSIQDGMKRWKKGKMKDEKQVQTTDDTNKAPSTETIFNSQSNSSINTNVTSTDQMADQTSKEIKEPIAPKTDQAPSEDTTQKTPDTGKPATQEISVKVDTSGLEKSIEELKKVVADSALKEAKPTGAVASDAVPSKEEIRKKFYDAVTNSLKKHQQINWDSISASLKADGIGMDAVGVTELGTAAGAQWLEDITIIPSGLTTSLRTTCEVVNIQRGAKECHFTLISTPTPGDGTAPTVPADVTHTITDVVATPAERILKQRLTDQAARFTATNLGQAIATTFRNAEMLDEDTKILTEINTITDGNSAGAFFAGNATSEATIDTADIFTHILIAKAKRALLRQGWQEARIPGGLVAVLSPEQMEQLMSDTTIQRFIEWVQDGEALRNGFIPRLHGVDILISTAVPTGIGNPTTVITHRAFVYVRQVAVGLGFTKELEIESARYPEERATTIVATYELAAKVKRDKAIAKIYSYGSGS